MKMYVMRKLCTAFKIFSQKLILIQFSRNFLKHSYIALNSVIYIITMYHLSNCYYSDKYVFHSHLGSIWNSTTSVLTQTSFHFNIISLLYIKSIPCSLTGNKLLLSKNCQSFKNIFFQSTGMNLIHGRQLIKCLLGFSSFGVC